MNPYHDTPDTLPRRLLLVDDDHVYCQVLSQAFVCQYIAKNQLLWLDYLTPLLLLFHPRWHPHN